MAVIYLAEQESLQRQVVLKFLNPKLDEAIRKRFIDEGRLIASLKHPNIITVFDVVSTGKYNFLAMEYLEGGDLERRLKTGIGTYEALDVINKISDALHLVHQQGIIHGDIKPANVLFRGNGCPQLTDFGISRRIASNKEINIATDDLYASPSYASPELIQGKPFDKRTDIYSLGIMMYEMLVGERPYTGETEIETIANSIQEPIPQLPGALQGLQPLVETLLAKLPENRLSDSKVVTDFITQYLKDHPELKAQSSETKPVDSDVIVEYVSRKKDKKQKTSNSVLSPLFLTLILFLVIWLNREPLWQQWFAGDQSKKGNTVTVKQTSSSLRLKQSDQQLLKQESLINQKNEEITRVKIELEKQNNQIRQKQINQQLMIANFLKKGQSSIKDYRLTTPLNNNALYFYQKILEIEPDNKKAQKGIKDVVYRYETLARSELKKYHYQKAQQYISTGLSIDSDNKRLLELQNKANVQNEPGRVIKKVTNFFKNL